MVVFDEGTKEATDGCGPYGTVDAYIYSVDPVNVPDITSVPERVTQKKSSSVLAGPDQEVETHTPRHDILRHNT